MGKEGKGSSRNKYKGLKHKAKGGRFVGGSWGWEGRRKVVAGKRRKLYLDSN